MDEQAPKTYMETDSIVLNAGLDLRSPKLLAQPGAIIDCLNREIVDSIGLRRIDGFEPYDGRITPAQQEYFIITASGYVGSVSSGFALLDELVISGTTNVFGKVVARNDTDKTISYVRLNRDFEPAVGQTVTPNGGGASFIVTAKQIGSVVDADAITTVNNLNDYAALLRADIEGLHSTPIGLHWYRDRAYTVVTDRLMYFTSGGTVEVEPNYYIKGNTTGAIAKVLAVQLGSGTWALGTAAGSLQYALLTATDFSGTETLTYSNDEAFATNLSADVATRATSGTSALDYASLWQSRNELQAQTESASVGWSHLEHGWTFDYENGLSDNGVFTKIEKSTTNNFTFTADNEAVAPVSRLNGMNITGLAFAPNSNSFVPFADQVQLGSPGWKTNASSTAFATNDELETALVTADPNFAYGNLTYYGAGSTGSSGYPAGQIIANDKGIAGPTTSFFGGSMQPANVGTETFDIDFFNTQARAPVVLKDFSAAASSVPEGSLIVGVEVIVRYSTQHYAFGTFILGRNTSIVQNTIDWIKDSVALQACLVDTVSNIQGTIRGTAQSAPLLIQGTAANYQSSITPDTYDASFVMAATLAGQTATIGGNGNVFGATNLTRSSLLDTNLGIALVGQITTSTEYPIGMQNYTKGSTTLFAENTYGTIRIKVDTITVRFYYTTPSARYYARDGASSVCSVDLIYYVNRDGSLTSATGEGNMQVTNVNEEPTVVGSTKRMIRAGDTLHLTVADAVAGTNAIATATTDMVYKGFPGIGAINEANSRYQFITANFYGVEDWDGFYGVSGAGKAFSFSSFNAGAGVTPYIIDIYTNTLDEAGDKPRHIAYHHGSLALGFSSGVVRFSVSGLPENFDGEFGASEIGIGDRITGLLPLVGTTLAVFGENSIHGLNGTDPQSIDPQILAPKTGAIEYTVVDMGVPVFCDSRGISTLGQTQKYGNFQGRRLSYPVVPWINQRMVTSDSLFSTANGIGVVCAIPIRSKNQYLLFFKDGYVLCMTMNADESAAFTYRRYYLNQANEADTNGFVVPIAWCAEVDERGVERTLISHYSTLSSQTSNYVYELDRGWGFAGKFIPAFYDVNWHYKDPFTFKNIRKVRLDGLTQGITTSVLYTSSDYSLNFQTQGTPVEMPEQAFDRLYQDFKPASAMINTADYGRAIGIRIKDEYLDTINDPTPPDIHQVLLLQYPMGGKPDG